MNFVGMVFELVLCGVWWAVAIALWVYLIADLNESSLNWAQGLLDGAEYLGASAGVIFLVVAYALGQAGRQVAQDHTYRRYRRWIDAAIVYNDCGPPERRDRGGFRARHLEDALGELTDLPWSVWGDTNDCGPSARPRRGRRGHNGNGRRQRPTHLKIAPNGDDERQQPGPARGA